ncbi:MAG: transketolase [Candidatus Brocadiaceae bacterium]|nr:transketolase [Candidatus Brocadiaceae bacterium]
MSLEDMDIETLCVNTIRTLSIDMVHKANSGHPGAPLGCAAIAHVLWSRFLKHDPSDPTWPDRDRFVLSAGHASALLYSLLHLHGYDLPIEELVNFRQLGSRTPGHPEAGHTPGVELTTGPLGQGLGSAVGMALAEAYLAARYNEPGHTIVDHRTYVLASDGDMMEGVSHEAASLAGVLKLGKLIVLYDSNDISLEGPTAGWFADDTAARFRAYGWHVTHVDDATNDLDAIAAAIEEARNEGERPSLVVCRTHIGYGSPLQDSHQSHGKALNAEEMAATKRALGWPEDQVFLVPERVRQHMAQVAARGRAARREWEQSFKALAAARPEQAAQWRRAWAGELPDGWDANLPVWTPQDRPLATRSAAGDVLDALRDACPHLIGGCADLASSTRTLPKSGLSMEPGVYGRQNIRFGVREHLMGAACNGIVRHGGLRAYGSTFLVFSDYVRPSLRMAGLMNAGVVYQFTHDSIGVGEDGPTHQPAEHLAALRCIPNWTVIRPCDANEAREAWRAALLNADGPTALACSRQNLPVLDRTVLGAAEGLHRGAYVLSDPADGEPEIILMASGSEVAPTLEAARTLTEAGRRVRVVSFPSWELFEKQDEEYRRSVLPPAVRRRIAVEAGVPMGWERYAGADGEVIGLPHFGVSGPGGQVMKKLGFCPEHIADRARAMLDS